MIQAVTFDLDGTLIDSTEAIVNAYMHTMDAFGEPPPPRQAVVDSIGYTLEDQFRLLSKNDPEACARVYRKYYEQIACDETKLLPGARDTLERLSAQGLKLAFATSKKLEYAEMILRHFKLLDFFASRIGPGEVTHPKPHPEAVLKSAANLDVAVDAMFFVGDMHFDVTASHAAGVRCVCVTTGYASRKELETLGPEAVFDFLPEATDYILAHLD